MEAGLAVPPPVSTVAKSSSWQHFFHAILIWLDGYFKDRLICLTKSGP